MEIQGTFGQKMSTLTLCPLLTLKDGGFLAFQSIYFNKAFVGE